LPLNPNLPLEEKARVYEFWAQVFEGIGFEPVTTKNPPSLLLLAAGTVNMLQVEALRAVAGKYLSFADKLEADVRRLQPVVPQNGDEPYDGAEDDMPAPRAAVPAAPPARRRAAGRDGRGGPVPPPVAPRERTRGR